MVANASGLNKTTIREEEAAFTYHNTPDAENLCSAFQAGYNLEAELSGGQFLK